MSLKERLMRRKTHRLAAHVSREDQWDYDVPNIRLSRAFVVVVVLHIVAVGGILVFEVLKPDGRGSVPLADGSELASSNTGVLNNAIPEGVKIGDPRAEGFEHYIVRAGDTVKSIADKYGLTEATIERQNGLDRGGRIYPGRNLFIPKNDAIPSEAEIGMVATTNSGGASAGGNAIADNQPQRRATEMPILPAPAQPEATTPAPPQRQPEIVTVPPTPAPAPVNPPVRERPRYAVTETPTSAPAAPAPVRPVSGQGGGYHVMARGETPYAIARRYGVNVNQLLKANGISDPTNIKIGKKLKIPSRR